MAILIQNSKHDVRISYRLVDPKLLAKIKCELASKLKTVDDIEQYGTE